jgi:hypothetical protein
MWLDIITSFAKFQIRHIPRQENSKTNMLDQQAQALTLVGVIFTSRKKICANIS